MREKVYYLGYYDTPENIKENRQFVLAATNKMTYVVSAITNIGYAVEIISSSGTRNSHFYPGTIRKLGDNVILTLLPTFPYGNKFFKLIQLITAKISLFFYLMIKIEKKSRLIVYHSCSYMTLIKIIKKLKKCYCILEAEEIYADVLENPKKRKREISFIRKADAYIFPTELLNELVNTERKPYCIIHGTYQSEPVRKRIFHDKKIHVVYAGTFDPRKGGAAMAATAAKFLPKNYHIHILGFGTEKQIGDIQDLIRSLSEECSCSITYDGLKSGEEYIQFIQSCDIGLSTQNPDAAFNDTSFPSKILSYMANGLRVVSVRIPAVETSAIGDYMYYYDKQTPEEIAKAIMQADLNDGYDGRKVIRELDDLFKSDIDSLLEVE